MNVEELNLLVSEGLPTVIGAHELKNQKPRTLLYGYDRDGITLHVYLCKDGFINVYWYWNNPEQVAHVVKFDNTTVANIDEIIPNKRLYPACCDYEFCTLLKRKGANLSFTTFDKDIEVKQFYGKIKR